MDDQNCIPADIELWLDSIGDDWCLEDLLQPDEVSMVSAEPPRDEPNKTLAATAPDEIKPPIVKRILRAVSDLFFFAVCIFLVGGSMLFAINNDPGKYFFGYRTYNILTDSMTPKADGSSPAGGFGSGAMIIVQKCPPEDIGVGDIITFNPGVREGADTAFLTHRVVDVMTELNGKEDLFFVTKGDFNNYEDPPITRDMVIGKKVLAIPAMGAALQWIHKNIMLSMTILLSFFASIFMFRWYFAQPKEAPQTVRFFGKKRFT